MAFTYKHGDRPLDGYEIQRGVGRGGFGEVYYAISDGGREVALKYLRENPEVELRGISQCINLKSPHLVSIFDVKQSDQGDYFVIMEYISGPSLRDMLIAEPNGLGTQKAAFFAREIAKGLSYLHDRGIVHRDLKPGNIFYEDGYVKICDYGLSKFISLSRHSAQTASVGTVHYMAPEIGSGNYSKTIDIYALGVILYEMLLGRVPYEGASMGEVLMKHLTQQPEVDNLVQPFAAVIRKALAKEPAERFQEVNELVQAIFDVQDIKQSVLGFEPTSLTMVAKQAAADIRPSPVPSNNPLRGKGRLQRTSSDDFSRRFVERTLGMDVREVPGDAKKGKKKRKGKGSKGKKKGKPQLLGTSHDDHIVRSDYRIGFLKRMGRLFAAFVLAGVFAFGIGFMGESPELGGVSFGVMLLTTLGIGIGTKIANWLGPDHPWMLGKILQVVWAAPAAGLIYSAISDGGVGHHVFTDRHLNSLFIPFLAGIAITNWHERIRKGMRGELAFWEAAWVGFLAYLIGLITFDFDDEEGLYIGVLVATCSLAVQAFSWAMIRNPLRVEGDGNSDDRGSESDNDNKPAVLDETQVMGKAVPADPQPDPTSNDKPFILPGGHALVAAGPAAVEPAKHCGWAWSRSCTMSLSTLLWLSLGMGVGTLIWMWANEL